MTETYSFAEFCARKPSLTDRHAYRHMSWDVQVKKFRTREALAKSIRRQEKSAAHNLNWHPAILLQPHEGR